MSDKLQGGIKAGSTSVSLPVILRKTADNTENTGTLAAGVTAYYWRQGGTPTALTAISDLAAITTAWAAGGWKAADATNQPGVYRLDVDDAAFATGADWVVISVKVASCYLFVEKYPLTTNVVQSANNPTAAAVATAVWQDTTAGDFTVASSIGKSLFTSGVVPGAAGGLFIAGTNAATTITTGLTAHIIGTVDTVTTLTNLPSIPANWLTAAGINAGALNGKGDWLLASSYTTPPTTAQIATGVWQDATAGDFTTASSIGKSLYTTGNAPGAASGLALVGSNMGTVSSVTGAVGSVTAGVTVTTNNDKTGYALTAGEHTSIGNDIWDTARSGHVVAGSFGRAFQEVRDGTAQAGAATTITLDSGASAVDNFYNNCLLEIIGGTGIGQSRFITGYVGSTKVATVNSAWKTNPDVTSVFSIAFFDAVPGASAPTAAQVATAVWQDTTAGDFTVASSIGKSLYTTGNAPGAASGLALVGSNMGSVASVTAGVTVTTNNDKTGYSLTVTPPTAATIATTVWQDTTAGDFTTAGSIGKSLFTSGNAPGAASGLAIVGSNMGTVTSVTGAVGSVTGNVGGNVVGSVGSVTGAVGSVTGNVGGNVVGSVGSVTGAVGSVTAGVTVTTNNDKTGYSLAVAPPTLAQISTAILTTALTESYAGLGATFTLSQALYEITQLLENRAIVGTTLTAKKRDGATAAMTFTLDSATVPTSQVRAS